MIQFFKKEINGTLVFVVIVIGAFLLALLIINLGLVSLDLGPFSYLIPRVRISRIPRIPISIPESQIKEIKKFSSEKEFEEYLQKSVSETAGYPYGFSVGTTGLPLPGWKEVPLTPTDGMGGGGEEVPERISKTTVQVAGIDEPDIVKTDGKEIYFSPGYSYHVWREPILEEGRGSSIPPEPLVTTNVIKAFPPADLVIDAKIEEGGDLLLNKNILIVFTGQKIYGYNVSNPKSPEKKWEIELENNSSLAGARLYKDKVYLVTKSSIDEFHPCPIKPLKIGDTQIEIGCTEIYHPVVPVPVDTTFVSMVLNPVSGKVEKKISFIGSSDSSVIYMSEKAIYSTYSYYESYVRFFYNFFKEKCGDLVPQEILTKLERLESYDIGQESKMMEFERIWSRYLGSLNYDEQRRIENEFSNRMADYYKDHKRDLEKTGIVKIAVETLGITATGSVPGSPLNQFSLDEYNNNLRIATTTGSRWGWGGFTSGTISGGESANDVYVLDKDLKIQGQITEMGLTEKIYSVRFVEDKGYLVTFKQTDPFYVLDLSNPKKPTLKGELKIPGYSSYLHPITKDKILGIGQESWQVKISLFNVSSPEKPVESDKYILDQSWSDVLSTHHAFLLDDKHEIFFLPGSREGYIFSYKNDKLELVKVVTNISARRAIYLNDYLYIIGDDKISVFNETDWQKVNGLEL